MTSGFIKYRKCITTTNSTYTYCNRTAYKDPNYEREDVSYTNETGSYTVTITGLAQEVTEQLRELDSKLPRNLNHLYLVPYS